MYSLYTDGSAMPNPGPCGCGAVLIDESENIIWTLSEFLGQGTNNIGEFTAILRGCSRFAELGLQGELAVYSDSELCVGLVSGSKKARKPHLQCILDRVLEIKASTPFTITWVKAHNNMKWNEVADKLANNAVASVASYGDQKYKDKDTGPRLYIKCSFADKDKVKGLGARWDPAKKSWWAADSPANHDKFAEWIV